MDLNLLFVGNSESVIHDVEAFKEWNFIAHGSSISMFYRAKLKFKLERPDEQSQIVKLFLFGEMLLALHGIVVVLFN